MRRCIIVFFFTLMFTNGYCQSSHLIFKHLDRAAGLPVDEINCLARDSSGFMWLGTTEGLYKFDGFSYKASYKAPADVKATLNSHISNIHVDRKGFIWVGTSYNGIVLLNSSAAILDVLNTSTSNLFTNDRIMKICEDSQGHTWCSTDEGLFEMVIIDAKIKVLRKVDLKKLGYSSNSVGELVFDLEGRMWICTYSGLVVYDLQKNILYHRRNNPDHLPFLDLTHASGTIFIDQQKKKIWYCNWEPALQVYDEKTAAVTTIYSGKGLPKPDYSWMVHEFYLDSHQRLWIATGRGIYLADQSFSKLEQQFAHEPENNSSIIHNNVMDIHEDKEGTFWMATEKGISLTKPYAERFLNISGNALKEFSFAGKAVTTIINIDTATLLLCTYAADGIYETGQDFHVKKHYSFGSMSHDWAWTFYHDKKNNQYYISTQKGMLLYNTVSHSLKKLTTPPFDKFYPVTAFIPGKDGTIWMSRYWNEFIQYDPVKGSYTSFDVSKLGMAPQIIKIALDSNDNFWIIGNATGLLRFDRTEKKIVETIGLQKDKAHSLMQTEVILFKDLGAYYLLGYDQKGFSLYNKKTKAFEHYNRSNGLAGNRVNDALMMDDGNIWLATSNGISRFNLNSREMVSYNYDNGILDNNIQCIYQLQDGRMAAGTTTGIIVFDPATVKAETILPQPFVSSINIYGNELPADSILHTGHPLNISYRENYFSVDYICLQYSHQQQIEYAYMLEGFDKNWIAAGNRRFVSYANLAGGNYSFKLKARLPGNNWVESSTTLSIRVNTAFYMKWWFISLCAVLFVAVVYALFRYRVHQLLRMEKMRTAISSDLHDEVGASLSSISIFSEMAKQSLAPDSKAEQYLQRIGDRSRDSIEKMSDIIWSINPDNDSFQEMITRMKNFVNEMLEAKDITLHWQESENISALKLGMAQRKNFYLLFKEAIMNAVKYSDAKNIFIQLSAQQSTISLKVKDDGKGFNPTFVKPGNGIKNIQQRAILLNGSATIESIPGTGTKVHVQFRY